MIAYSKERLDNAVAHFAKCHEEITGDRAYKTYIFKYIALFDFMILEETGKPAFDINYDAFERGPVPTELYDHIDEYSSSFFSIIDDENGNHFISPSQNINMDYFSKFEQEKINQVVEESIFPGMKTDDVCNKTHVDILAWQIAWENRGTSRRVPMDYSEEFKNILDKEEADLSPEEESFLVYRGLKLANYSTDRDSI